MPRRRSLDSSGHAGLVREPMWVMNGTDGRSISRLLARMRQSAFQGRKLGEAFHVWTRMIDGASLICLGLAGSMSSAGMWPLVAWLVERGYVDLLVSTAANVTEDLLEQRGARFYCIDPSHVDDSELWDAGYYRFYDHVVSAAEYDAMEDFIGRFFGHLDATWREPVISGASFMYEFGRWLDSQGFSDSIAATCYRKRVPLFVPAAADGPFAEAYRTAQRRGPVVDFFKDYDVAVRVMHRYMAPDRGTSAIFLGGGVPKDFIQTTATSVCAFRGNMEASPHGAAIQITTDNEVFGGLSGAGIATEAVSWGKESPAGLNVMVFTDLTIALPLLCQGLSEHYGPMHTRDARLIGGSELVALLRE